VTRNNSERTAGGNTKESMRHAAEVVVPYAMTARDSAVQYAHEAGQRLRPMTRRAVEQTRGQCADYLVPRLRQARTSLPDGFDVAASRAAERTRDAANRARATAAPRMEEAMTQARAAAGPVREAAAARSVAAVAALRGDITAREIRKVVRRRRRRARTGRLMRRMGVVGLMVGGVVAAWKWWERQTNPDWLMEPPAATEVSDTTPSSEREHAELPHPEAEARQTEAEAGPTEAARREAENQAAEDQAAEDWAAEGGQERG
jgi:hypothetical protein